jgi:hypothetical protein
VGKWLLPFAGMLVLSATVAWAADQGLVGSHLLAEPVVVATPPADAVPNLAPTDTVVVLWSINALGGRISVACVTNKNRVSADVLEIPPEELVATVANLCIAANEAVQQPT